MTFPIGTMVRAEQRPNDSLSVRVLHRRPTRRHEPAPPVGPDVAISGMVRFGLSLSDTNNRWQSSFIPTQASAANWRFVGDSRATTFATMIGRPWETPATLQELAGKDGRRTFRHVIRLSGHWVQRDYVRSNPSIGRAPASIDQTPAQVSPV